MTNEQIDRGIAKANEIGRKIGNMGYGNIKLGQVLEILEAMKGDEEIPNTLEMIRNGDKAREDITGEKNPIREVYEKWLGEARILQPPCKVCPQNEMFVDMRNTIKKYCEDNNE